ncbi:MAG: hypothetical protein M3O03_14995 [Pseudomonadota bacterium]|nr:hypothetical protein [Pseudomonadota bacterium]
MMTKLPDTNVHSAFAEIAKSFAGDDLVTFGEGKGFGANALKVHGKIFAMISSKNVLVLKLPKARVNQMVKDGLGDYFDPGHGRKMKEWLEYRGSAKTWIDLAHEARDFVGRT